MRIKQSIARVVLCASLAAVLQADVAAAEPVANPPSFTAEVQKARQAILDSDRWKAARKAFDQWLSIQAAYDESQLADMKRELGSRIAAMDDRQLASFLGQMEQRLAVLLSPDVSAARTWAEGLYTRTGQQKLMAKYGAANPLELSADELSAALTNFARDRQVGVTSQAAFDRQRQAEVAAAHQYHKTQQAVANAPPKRAASYSTPYAPRAQPPRPQRYQAPYNPMHYSVDPWGGVWIGH